MKKLFGFLILVFVVAAQAAPATIFKNITSTIAGTIPDSGFKSSTIDRRSVSYPQNCEMTYTLHAYCGDGDVANYYSAAANADEQYGHGNGSYALVLGYWMEPSTGPLATHVPTYDNFYAVGYDHLALDTSHAGVQVINSNKVASSTEVLKKESERVVALAALLDDADQYRMYVAPMLCNDDWIATTPGSEARRNAGMVDDGEDHPFEGQICDDAALASANVVPGIFTTTTDPSCPSKPADTATCSYVWEYTAAGLPTGSAPVCKVVSSCTTAPPASGTTTPPSGGACTGTNYTVTPNSGGTYPTSTTDCPSGSTYYVGGAYVPPMCLCSNYATPTPTPAPTAPPTPTPSASAACTGSAPYVAQTSPGVCPSGTTPYVIGYPVNTTLCACSNYTTPTPTPTPAPPPPPPNCATVQAGYTSQCPSMGYGAGTISCSVTSGHTYLYDTCGDGSYFIGYDGGTPTYVYPYFGF